MELSSIITGVVFIAIIALPVIILSKSGNKKKKALLQRYQALCTSLGLNINGSDTWNDLVLGMDKNARKLLFYKDGEAAGQHTLVDLNHVVNVKKINITRGGNTQSGAVNIIDILGLELALKDGQGPVTLEFYNSKYPFNLSNELELVGKWTKAISENMK